MSANNMNNKAALSLPTDKPFRLIIDVKPVHGEAIMPGLDADHHYKVRTGLERIEFAVTVEEMEGAENE